MSYIQYLRKYVGSKPIIAPGSAIVVLNESKEILLQLRSDTNDWGLPGGGMEMGETFEETAARELFEETGLIANKWTLLDIVSGQDVYFKYPHGDEIFNATAIYRAEDISGEMKKDDDESLHLDYFPLLSLPKLNRIAYMILKKINYID